LHYRCHIIARASLMLARRIGGRALALAALLSVSAAAVAPYNEAAALQFVRWVGVSYCPAAAIEAWTCKPCAAPTLPLTRVTYLYNATSNVTGVVSWSPSTHEVVVAFRGTMGVEEWLDDFDFAMVPAAQSLAANASCAGCQLSKGFSVDTYDSIRGQLSAAVRSTLAAGARVVVLGHSLGAAIAEVATFDLLAQGFPVAAHYSFGTPRVGNAAWAAAWTAAADAAGAAHYRIVHNLDLVPRLPPNVVFGFVHPPREVFYNENQSAYKLCGDAANGEDPACSDGDLTFKLSDHDVYLNLTLGASVC
jgi:hypothetical protein